MLVAGDFPNLINGVSQQVDSMRLSSQVESLKNGICSPVHGLGKRPPTRHLSKLMSGTVPNPFVYLINRDTTERYIVVITSSGSLGVYDINGNPMTLATPDGTGYLSITGDAYKAFRAVTVADTTFIVNRQKAVTLGTDTTAAQVYDGLIWIREALTGHSYTVEVNGTQVANFEDDETATLKTTDIAQSLSDNLVSHLSTDYTIVLSENLIYLKRKDGADYTLKVYDSYGNQASAMVKGVVQKFSDLPTRAYPGMLVKVIGDSETDQGDYWCEFVPDSADTFGTGRWEETAAPGIKTGFDPTTMPYLLQRTGVGEFTFKKAAWLDREVGDDESAPPPSFVGKTLNDVFVFKGRLGLLAGEGVSLSRVGDWFNFWPTTVTTILDDGRIDHEAGGTAVATLFHAVPWADQLLLFSDQSQLTLTSDGLLTPKSVSISVTTRFDGTPDVRPVNAGNSIYFPFPRGRFSGVREYFMMDQGNLNDAVDISSHVPTYISGNVKQITASTAVESMAVVTDDGSNSWYVYQWLWSGNQKVQSAWHEWDIGGEALGVAFLAETLYVVVQRSNGVYLESIDTSSTVDDGEVLIHHLDRRVVSGAGSYDSNSNVTTFILPYYDESIQAVTSGRKLKVYSNTDNGDGTSTIKVTGDASGSNIYLGVPYTFDVQLTKPYVKADAKGGGTVAIADGRLQIQRMVVRYADSGYFKVRVRPDGLTWWDQEFTGRMLGSSDNLLDSVILSSGGFPFPVRGNNESAEVHFVSDSHMPCHFLSASWFGIFVPQAQRI